MTKTRHYPPEWGLFYSMEIEEVDTPKIQWYYNQAVAREAVRENELT